jgi:hypothetical protein
MVKVTFGGRPFDAKRFGETLEKNFMGLALNALEEKARGAAASLVDPATGRHADVFVDRQPNNRIAIRTNGSAEFARLLEKRLGVGVGEVKLTNAVEGAGPPRVYLAHASEDKAMVRPIAEYLMANGIEVWFDEWEIEVGDSLRQRMEEGLAGMTHFMVVLTPASIAKPWVAREIDVGMVRLVGGESRMVPVVVGLDPALLTPFLRTLLYVKINPADVSDLKRLVDRLHGVSRKPALGAAPRYVVDVPEGLRGWSPAAVAIGRHFIESSKDARACDPVLTVDQLAEATNLDATDVRLGALDLKEAGYLREMNIRGHYTPELPLFVDFDETFMPFSPAADAVTVANALVTAAARSIATKDLASELKWEPRRMNSAICFLLRVGAIETRTALASGPWRAIHLISTDRTIRFARSHA